MGKFLCYKNLGAKLCIIMFSLAALISCQNKVERDRQLFENDLAAKTELQKLNAELNNSGQISPEDFEKLKRLCIKFPDLPEISKSYRAALIYREDWEAIQSYLRDIPPSDLSREDTILLAKVYIKLGKFEESSETLQGLATEGARDPELSSLSALAHFNLGQLNEAAADLDSVWDLMIGQKRIDDINLRGLIYFRTKNYDKAIGTLLRSIELEPNNPVAANTLSRAYAAVGDTVKAEQYRLETEKFQDLNIRDETRRLQFVSLSRKIETAWNEKRYEDVVAIAKQMLEFTDEKNKAAILKYIGAAETELKKHNIR